MSAACPHGNLLRQCEMCEILAERDTLLEILRNLILKYGSDDVRDWRNAREFVDELDKVAVR